MDVIELNNLTRDYGQNKGIYNLSFSIPAGETFGFLGPNGAGKTTTLRHLMGFLQPQKGSCHIQGQDCWKNRESIQKNLGYLPGEISFPNEMTGTAFLHFYGQYRGMKNNNRMNDLLERFELDPHSKLKKMSKGMKQKIGIVAAFMHDPAVLLLDEPTSGLDPLMQNRFVELIQQEKERGKTILMSSHMFEEVERTCSRVGIIRQGAMAAVDTMDSLKQKRVKKYVITLQSEAAAQAFSKSGLLVESTDACRVTVLVQNNFPQFTQAMAQAPVVNISAPTQSLEEIFLHYYGEGANA